MSDKKIPAATAAAAKEQARRAQQKASASAKSILQRSTQAINSARDDLKGRSVDDAAPINTGDDVVPPPKSSIGKSGQPNRDDLARVDGIYTIVFNRLRNWLARSALRYSIILNITLGVIVAILGVSLAGVATQPPPEPKYFATNPNGTIMELIPLSKPMGSKSVVLTWATRVATECYTFSFSNMERVVRDCENAFFTESGAGAYRKALTGARLFEDVRNLELFHESSSPEAAVILDTGEISGRLAYKIKIPVITRFVGPRTAETSKRQNIFLIALRVPPTESKDGSGIAVHQFVVE